MFNVCPSCGLYSEDKDVRPVNGLRAVAICNHCGHAQGFLRLPLFVITGASGTGKSTLVPQLVETHSTCIHLESDILWRPEFNRPENNYRDYRNLWLRLAKNIAQGGKPVALYGSVVPDQFENCPERRFLAVIHYLALVCDPDVLTGRLQARPSWRASGSAEFVEGMLCFNRWFQDNAALTNPPMTLLDTTHMTAGETARAVGEWIDSRWSSPAGENLEDND